MNVKEKINSTIKKIENNNSINKNQTGGGEEEFQKFKNFKKYFKSDKNMIKKYYLYLIKIYTC